MNDAKSNLPKLDAEEILTGVLRWVEVETPSHDGKAVNRLVDQVEQAMAVLGAKITRTPGRDGFGDILRARTPWGGDKPGILVLSHLDTVHPKGSIDGVLKVRRDGDKVYGPGIYDMKAGAYIAHYALRHLVREGKETPLPITYLYVPEEEIGSPTSRALIEAEAKKNKYVLVTEPAREGGKIVTARKGVARFCVAVKGRPAHAGARHQDGRSAIKEMAKQILRFEALTDYDLGVTASVGLVQGGTGVNVIPAECTAEVDMRMPDAATAKRVVAEV
ncbi:MAG: M20/M25/M40 family metallo-hydrolase, partial [Rhodospirillales bacterium]